MCYSEIRVNLEIIIIITIKDFIIIIMVKIIMMIINSTNLNNHFN